MNLILRSALICGALGLIYFLSPQRLQAQVSCTHDPANCCWENAGTYTLTQSQFNCAEMFVGAGAILEFDSSVSDPITFNISGDVQIDGRVDVSANGRIAGPGGGNGGEAPDTATGGDGGNGQGLGAGEGGQGSNDVFSEFTAGGGAGAKHSGILTVNNGFSGDGNGGEASGSSYGNPLNFRQTISAGSGGGAGGSGSNFTSFGQAGYGGGGGGTIRILIEGTLWLNGEIFADADNGSPANVSSNSGGGGGGSGGSIFVSALEDIIIDIGASLSAFAGAGGTGNNGAGNGSDGDHGYIHLEDQNETIPLATDVSSPNATTRTNPLTITQPISGDTRIFQSDLSTGCAVSMNIHKHSSHNVINHFILILSFGFLLLFLFSTFFIKD